MAHVECHGDTADRNHAATNSEQSQDSQSGQHDRRNNENPFRDNQPCLAKEYQAITSHPQHDILSATTLHLSPHCIMTTIIMAMEAMTAADREEAVATAPLPAGAFTPVEEKTTAVDEGVVVVRLAVEEGDALEAAAPEDTAPPVEDAPPPVDTVPAVEDTDGALEDTEAALEDTAAAVDAAADEETATEDDDTTALVAAAVEETAAAAALEEDDTMTAEEAPEGEDTAETDAAPDDEDPLLGGPTCTRGVHAALVAM